MQKIGERTFGVYVGETPHHIVRRRAKFKIRNSYSPSTEYPMSQKDYEEQYGPIQRDELEQLYLEFVEKAWKLVQFNSKFSCTPNEGDIVFPDLYYEVVFPTIQIK